MATFIKCPHCNNETTEENLAFVQKLHGITKTEVSFSEIAFHYMMQSMQAAGYDITYKHQTILARTGFSRYVVFSFSQPQIEAFGWSEYVKKYFNEGKYDDSRSINFL